MEKPAVLPGLPSAEVLLTRICNVNPGTVSAGDGRGQAGGSFVCCRRAIVVFLFFGKGRVVLSNIRQASSCVDR